MNIDNNKANNSHNEIFISNNENYINRHNVLLQFNYACKTKWNNRMSRGL